MKRYIPILALGISSLACNELNILKPNKTYEEIVRKPSGSNVLIRINVKSCFDVTNEKIQEAHFLITFTYYGETVQFFEDRLPCIKMERAGTFTVKDSFGNILVDGATRES